jgi:hypothetical protein
MQGGQQDHGVIHIEIKEDLGKDIVIPEKRNTGAF